MAKIDWCKKQKNGIELIEPNEDLSLAYIKKAENSLKASAALIANKEWRISSLYYAMYFSVYAILMKLGIKCEIHSCTIAVAQEILHDYFEKDDMELLKKSMKARIDVQYYTDRNISDAAYQEMISKAPIIIAKCKETLNQITEKEVKKIRSLI